MGKVELLPTIKSVIKENSAWCATLQICFNELFEKILNNDFRYRETNQDIEDFISLSKEKINYDEKVLYTKIGKQTIKTKKEIEKAIKKKFKEKSDILNQIKYSKDENTMKMISYAMLKILMNFPKKYEKRSKFMFGKKDKNFAWISYFGFKNIEGYENQIIPLFYIDGKDGLSDEFAVELLTEDDSKSIVLYRTDRKLTFDTAFSEVKYQTEHQDSDNTELQIGTFYAPDINLNLLKEFDLSNIEFLRNKDKMIIVLDKAIQTLKLELNNEGAKVKSEAIVSMKEICAFIPKDTKKDFNFTDTFYLFILDKENPIVALRVHNIENFID